MAVDTDQILVLAGAAGALLSGMLFGKGKKETPTETQATVLAGTILSDGKVLREVIDGIDAHKDELKEGREQRHRDTGRLVDALDSHSRALRDNTEEVRQNTVALRNSGSTPETLAMMRRLIGGEK